MIRKLLIANRGEIACRVIRTARRMGIRTVAVHSEADARAPHVRLADEAVFIGPAPAAESYLSIDRVIAAVRATGADAVHPGYGFLSENPRFAAALAAEGVTFVGPPAAAVETMGDKIASKRIAAAAGVSTVPGHPGVVAGADEAVRAARDLGFPVMIKASAGGGGKGMRVARSDAEVREGFEASQAEARAAFGDDRLLVERFVESPRHVEIQVLADRHGAVLSLGERECSVQRRNQKVVEEAPSPALDEATRRAMGEEACALARAVGYESAGTVEFILGPDGAFYFLEMNTRLQVEHPVTEMVTGLDLVEWMIRVADGEALPFRQEDVRRNGWAIEGRVYAEDPYRRFLPSTGRLTRYRPPPEGPVGDAIIRIDAGVEEGGEVSRFYDPMIAKLVAWAPTREGAAEALAGALDAFELEGVGHNLPFLRALVGHSRFRAGDLSTAFIAEEWPEGFAGAALPEPELRRVAAAAAAMWRVAEIRRARVSGRLGHHERRVGAEWVVSLAGFAASTAFPVSLRADREGADVAFADGASLRVEGPWVPGQTLARLLVDGSPLVLKVDRATGGFRLRTGGADLRAHVRTPRAAALAALMLPKAPPDASGALLCPMPGLLTRLLVAEGDEVEEGQPLATVEAMKMENTLRAERRATVAALRARPGDALAVDQVILEFADPRPSAAP